MSAHLTGWRLSAGDEHHVFDGNNETLVRVACAGLTRRKFDQAADCARLIAAAPDLLAAGEALLEAAERHIFSGECKAGRDALRAAIAKARGT